MSKNDGATNSAGRWLVLILVGGANLVAMAGDGAKSEEENAEVAGVGKPKYANRLIAATSPYLLQHAHNPVSWYEWGNEALIKAQTQQKPIFLSIGYAACHWCHVMEHDVFEDQEIAQLLNKFFVCIKVDREERPDLDSVYMQATMVMTGNGGWPMSVFLTPDQEPFAAGTFFPRDVFEDIVRGVIGSWQLKTEEVRNRVGVVREYLDQAMNRTTAGEELVPADAIESGANQMVGYFDGEHGGVLSGKTNKFPPHAQIDLLLRAYARNGSDELIDAVNTTLTHIFRGGIYDQLGGGIYRYSADPEWLVPHFEKMLYDQALVSNMYLDAFQVTRNPLYADAARSIFAYVLDDLQSPEGGFYSTRDSDSGGMEGGYYIWTYGEVRDVLGDDDTKLFAAYHDVTEDGNYYDYRHPGPPVPYNILNIRQSAADVAKTFGLDESVFLRRIEILKQKMVAARAKRVPPRLDDKVLAEWNGMMIGSLARGARILNEPGYAVAAKKAANFVLDNMIEDGKLKRSYRVGKTRHTAFLSDHVFMIEGLLNLYEATFDPRWMEHAEKLAASMIDRYGDPENGGFFYTADDGERLIVRVRDAYDGAIPSASQLSAHVLVRLAALSGDSTYLERAERVIKSYSGAATESPAAFVVLMRAVDFYHGNPREIVIVGDPGDPTTKQMLNAVYASYLPNRIVVGYHGSEVPDNVGQQIPLLRDRKRVGGKTTAYVCRNSHCGNPVQTVEELKAMLADNTAQGQ